MTTDNYEEFTEPQIKQLRRYVTNVSGHVFALKNLPEVIKGALFSRYSRSALGLRTLLLKEFVDNNDEAAFDAIAGKVVQNETEADAYKQAEAIKKAQSFYDRILDGYGDDSIGELGGAHLAVENVSMIAAKAIEDNRIGGSPLEKSTRYIFFDQKVNGEYLFYREPILMTSAYRDKYVNTCNILFDTYSRLIPLLTAVIEQKFPKDPESSKIAYTAALRAKVLDCLRGLLPASTLTNMGIYGNGRFFEQFIHKLNCSPLVENCKKSGNGVFEELSKVIPSFIRRSDPAHKTHQAYSSYFEAMTDELKLVAEQHLPQCSSSFQEGVRLMSYDADAVVKVAAVLLFGEGNKSLQDILKYCKSLPIEDLERILDSGCINRENRRQKSPRALEHAFFTFELVADFGAYRDLHRHRMLTQERQQLCCDYGLYIPQDLQETPYKEEYCQALYRAKEVHDLIAAELPEEARVCRSMAFNTRWYMHANLRTLQWLCELRSSAAGHPAYRRIAQIMTKEVCKATPSFERFFTICGLRGV